jgi:hypothetical protein
LGFFESCAVFFRDLINSSAGASGSKTALLSDIRVGTTTLQHAFRNIACDATYLNRADLAWEVGCHSREIAKESTEEGKGQA